MSWTETDVACMRLALEQAAAGAQAGEVPVGAVVSVGGEIIAAAHNRTITDADPAGHAEVLALREAARRLDNHRLGDATLHVTLEPCVMCTGAIAEARVARVVFGAYDRKAGALGSVEDLSDSRALHHRFEVNGGLLADECAAPLKSFFSQKR